MFLFTDERFQQLITFEQGQLSLAETIDLFQWLVNTGHAWNLQGFIGRYAHDSIEQGFLMLGTTSHRGYWGQHIPSRFEVEPGTLGSPQYVTECEASRNASMQNEP